MHVASGTAVPSRMLHLIKSSTGLLTACVYDAQSQLHAADAKGWRRSGGEGSRLSEIERDRAGANVEWRWLRYRRCMAITTHVYPHHPPPIRMLDCAPPACLPPKLHAATRPMPERHSRVNSTLESYAGAIPCRIAALRCQEAPMGPACIEATVPTAKRRAAEASDRGSSSSNKSLARARSIEMTLSLVRRTSA